MVDKMDGILVLLMERRDTKKAVVKVETMVVMMVEKLVRMKERRLENRMVLKVPH